MSTAENGSNFFTTDPTEVRAIFDSLYITGALDDADIYEIVKADGETTRLHLGGNLRNFAGLIIEEAYPGCVATLLSEGEAT